MTHKKLEKQVQRAELRARLRKAVKEGELEELGTTQASAYLGVSETHIRRLVGQGKLNRYKLSGIYVFSVKDLDSLERNRSKEALKLDSGDNLWRRDMERLNSNYQ